MKKQKSGTYIGTSGWMYKDWGKRFYPPDMKKSFLEFLSQEFNTVEVNSSFYHLPLASTFKKWRNETPSNFVFAVKLSRYITHQLRLENCRQPLLRFFRSARELQEKLGVILIQLPPSLRYDEKILKKFCIDLEKSAKTAKIKTRFALEPRHKSFMDEKNAPVIRTLLKKQDIALVFPHSAKIPSFSPEDKNILTNFVYIRFHGPSEFAASRYGEKRLKPWSMRMEKWSKKGITIFVYFNNDVHGHAIVDARTLKKLLKIRSNIKKQKVLF